MFEGIFAVGSLWLFSGFCSFVCLLSRKLGCVSACSYCDPQYAFPPQKDVIRFAVNLVQEAVHQQPNTLIVTGSYTIGKERIFLGMVGFLDFFGCNPSLSTVIAVLVLVVDSTRPPPSLPLLKSAAVHALIT